MGADALRNWSTSALEAEVRRLEALAEEPAPEPRGSVAWRDVAAFLEPLDAYVGPERVDALLRAGGVDPAELRQQRERWLSWKDFQAAFDAFEPLALDGTARRIGGAAVDSKWFRFLPLGARTLPSLEGILRWGLAVTVGPGGLLYRGCDYVIVRRAADVIEMRFIPPEGGRLPKFKVESARGSLVRFAELTGAPNAEVDAVNEGDTVIFRIRHDRLRRARGFRLFRSGMTSMSDAIDEARDALRQRNHELRRRIHELEVSERARTALRFELDQRQEMEAVGSFAGAIAHDFNNLLAAILAHLDLVAPSVIGARARDDLDAARVTAEKAAKLSHQLLAVGRQTPLKIEELTPDEAFAGWREVITSAAGEAITVRFALGASGARVKADAAQLERVLVELALNASEAMPDGGELTVTTSIVGAAGSRVVSLRMDDTGTGMTPEIRARALEPCFTTRRERGAAGLGLPMVYGVVEQLGGTLHVRSKPGKGTTVEIQLPLVEATP